MASITMKATPADLIRYFSDGADWQSFREIPMSISAWLAEVVADRDIHELSVRNREMEVWPQGPGCKFNEEWHFSGLRSEWTRGVTLPRFLRLRWEGEVAILHAIF